MFGFPSCSEGTTSHTVSQYANIPMYSKNVGFFYAIFYEMIMAKSGECWLLVLFLVFLIYPGPSNASYAD